MDEAVINIFCADRIANKRYNELTGLCKGIIADKEVNETEAKFLLNWLEEHPEASELFPANQLLTRLSIMLKDSRLDKEEAAELLLFIQELTGEKGQEAAGECPTTLCLDNPMPLIQFENCFFCLTGTFQSGQRSEVASLIASLGGEIVKNPVKKNSCYLVVGSLVTKAWLYSSHGRKIEKAVAYREEGCPICIISEDHLWNELQRLGYTY